MPFGKKKNENKKNTTGWTLLMRPKINPVLVIDP
jgi:hypothetical protein